MVVVPEYCLPISVLLDCVRGDIFPAEGAVWVMGCESLTPAALAEFKQEAAAHCEVIHESNGAAVVQGTYFDPVACCFVTKNAAGALQKVVLFQFKTCPSRDPHFLENEHLRLGQSIYQFRNTDESLGFSAIICSDAFTLGADTALCRKLTDRSTLVHIQLNPNPRHSDYRQYRAETFGRSPTYSDCDIICLNWAQNVTQYENLVDGPIPWKNIGGSSWYLPQHRCSTQDHEVVRNDSLGLYYSLLEKRRHVLLFHYDEAVFELTVPKVANLGAAVLVNPLGPQANARYVWDAQLNTWQPDISIPDAGLNELLGQDEYVVAAFAALQSAGNRLSIERAVALSCGPHGISDSWHVVGKLETCQMKADEVVYRTTFCMDSSEDARTVRHNRVQQVATLKYILANDALPAQVRDLMGGDAEICWNLATPHTNVTKSGCLPALISYVGQQPLPDRIRGVADSFVELLRKEGKAHQRRVAVCYRKADGTTAFAEMPALTRIDHDGGSLANITTVL
ncbi:hypothetical protein [Collimonas fungivorans]|uniref:hypothetical protein n=1 Tax=Collimonas fungivorans TaxID=158899 RepID=UPI003FA35D06